MSHTISIAETQAEGEGLLGCTRSLDTTPGGEIDKGLFTFGLRLKRLIIIIVHAARTLWGADSFLSPGGCVPRVHTCPFSSVSNYVHCRPLEGGSQGNLELIFHPSKLGGEPASVGIGHAWICLQLCLGEVARPGWSSSGTKIELYPPRPWSKRMPAHL